VEPVTLYALHGDNEHYVTHNYILVLLSREKKSHYCSGDGLLHRLLLLSNPVFYRFSLPRPSSACMDIGSHLGHFSVDTLHRYIHYTTNRWKVIWSSLFRRLFHSIYQ